MRLLLDQNLAHRLAAPLQTGFPGSAHVRECGLQRAADSQLWMFARDRGFAILSKDDDFYQRSVLLGHPPKVVWLRLGNGSTRRVLNVIRAAAPEIEVFGADPEQSMMIVTPEGGLRY